MLQHGQGVVESDEPRTESIHKNAKIEGYCIRDKINVIRLKQYPAHDLPLLRRNALIDVLIDFLLL